MSPRVRLLNHRLPTRYRQEPSQPQPAQRQRRNNFCRRTLSITALRPPSQRQHHHRPAGLHLFRLAVLRHLVHHQGLRHPRHHRCPQEELRHRFRHAPHGRIRRRHRKRSWTKRNQRPTARFPMVLRMRRYAQRSRGIDNSDNLQTKPKEPEETTKEPPKPDGAIPAISAVNAVKPTVRKPTPPTSLPVERSPPTQSIASEPPRHYLYQDFIRTSLDLGLHSMYDF